MTTGFHILTVKATTAGTFLRVAAICLVLLALPDCDLSAQQLIRPGDFPTGLAGYWPLESQQKRMTAAGDAQVDTAQAKVGTGSLALDGTGDWLVGDITADPDFSFGQEHFTIEAWVRISDLSNTRCICSAYRQSPRGGWIFVVDSANNVMHLYDGTGNTRVSGASSGWQVDTWYHVAVVRDGDGIKFFRDGVQQGATQTPGPHYDAGEATLQVGAYDVETAPSNLLPGWIDELRISRGVARYSSNFTPSTTPFTTDEFTVCLLHFEGADASTEMTDSSHDDNYMGQDFSGNGNHLEIPGGVSGSGDAYWEGGQGSSADFERDNGNLLSISDASQTGLGITGSHSIAAWVRMESATIGLIAGKNNGQGAGYGMSVSHLGALTMRVQGNSYQTAHGAISVGKWHHVVGNFDDAADTVALFVDGNLASVTTTPNTLSAVANDFRLGNLGDGSEPFDGMMKDVAVWNRVLDPREIKSLALGVDLANQAYRPGDVGTPPTAWWKLNKLSGDAIDSSGNGHTGTSTNGVTASGGYLEGASRLFERSSSQYFTVPDSPDWDFGTGDYSVALWARFDSTGALHALASATGLYDQWITLYKDETSRLFVYTPPRVDSVHLYDSFNPVVGTWYHIAVSRSGGTSRLYIDGVEVDSEPDATNITVDRDIAIGRFATGSGTYHADGAIQDLAIWKGYGLSAEEIASLATGLPVQKEGVVDYFSMDAPGGNETGLVAGKTLTESNGTIESTAGKVGTARTILDMDTEYFDGGDDADFEVDAPAFFAWVKPTAVGKVEPIFRKYSGTTGVHYYINSPTPADVIQMVTDTTSTATTAATSAGTWAHVGGYFDGTTRKVFFNGAEENSDTGTYTANTSAPVLVGYDGASGYGDFAIDELVFLKRWLRDEEIKALYLRGLAGKRAFSSWLEAQLTGGSEIEEGTGIVSFPTQAVETDSAPVTVTITNTTSETLTDLAVMLSGLHPGDFVLDTTGMSTSLAPGASTSFTVTFSPLAFSSRSAVIEVTSSSPGTSNAFDFTVSGTGQADVPSITSLSSHDARPGDSITITGTGFSAVPANNAVWFTTTRGTVTSASPTQLTVEVPKGASSGLVSVSVHGYTAFSRRVFTPSYTGPGLSLAAMEFTEVGRFNAGTALNGNHVADLDGDGMPDLLAADSSGNVTSVLRNLTSVAGSVPSFDTKVEFSATGQPEGVAAVEITGDGKLDIVTSGPTSGELHLHVNGATPGTIDSNSFASTVISAGGLPLHPTACDFDGDGLPDLIAPIAQSGTVRIMRQTSPGNFAAPQDVASGGSDARRVVIGDFDGDGKQDFAVGHEAPSKVVVFRNTSTPGSISFSNVQELAVPARSYSLELADFNGDGKDELIAAITLSSVLRIWTNTSVLGTPSFGGAFDLSTAGSNNLDLAIADLNGDGKQDLAVATYDDDVVSLFENVHTGGALSASSFAARLDVPVGGRVYSVSACDLNGDYVPELVVTEGDADQLLVFQNQYVPAPTITTLSVNTGEPGSTIIITGTNFSTTPEDNIVWFGSVRGIVTAATDTQLTVTVPHGALAGPITVQVNGRNAQSAGDFTPTFESSGDLDAGSFATTQPIDGPANANGAAVSDFDGDGKVDLAVGSYDAAASNVTVYLNTLTPGSLAADAQFPANSLGTPGTVLSANPYVQGVAAGDLDGDGKPDLVTAHNTVSYVSVLRNTSTAGSASFESRVTFNVGGTPAGIHIADLNQDGRPEIIVATSAGVSVLRNTGSPGVIDTDSFAATLDLNVGGACNGVSARDLNGDAKPDIAATQSGGNLVVKENLSDPYDTLVTGSFGTTATFTSASGSDSMAISDLDLDGHLDVATDNHSAPSVSIFHNTGSGAMSARLSKVADKTSAGGAGDGLGTGDLNGDGKPDAARAAATNDIWEVFQNNSSPGTVTLADAINISTPFSAYGANVVDLDADGRPDIIGYSYDGSKLLLTRNIHTAGTPQISVEYPESTPLTDGTGVIDCGSATVGGSSGAINVTIRNTGTADLANLALSHSGAQMSEFSLGALPGTTLAPGASMVFTITFSPDDLGTRTAALQVASNVDGAENPFDLVLSGSGVNGTLTTNFTSGATVGLTTNGFIATGSTLNLTLGHAPITGTILTLVDNTGPDPIVGTFTNLPQGGTVTLPFGGTDYRFFVDYFGGTGNDIVLVLQEPGGLDLSFAGTGMVFTDIGNNSDEAFKIAVQNDGRILVAGRSTHSTNPYLHVIRYLPDGTLDTSFNQTGHVMTNFGAGGTWVEAMALQDDGKILVAGTSNLQGDYDFFIARFNPDGSPDSTFNSTGYAIASFSAQQDIAKDVVVQEDGRIVVAGHAFSGSTYAVARFNTDGTLDTTFNGTGLVTVDFGGGGDWGECLALQADGKIVVGGTANVSGGTGNFALARLLPDGSFDTSFNGTGKRVANDLNGGFDICYDVAIQADGGILAGGQAWGDLALQRYLSDGTRDTDFGTSGQVLRGDVADSASAIQIDLMGRILVAGYGGTGGSDLNFAVIRLSSDGTLDSTFNGNGRNITNLRADQDVAYAIGLQKDGKILLAGRSRSGSFDEVAVARYLVETSVSIDFSHSEGVGFSVDGLDGTERTLDLTLSFPPTPGTRLTVFDNTSLHPILGEFSNLAHGQEILLSHGGSDYPFVANYFGGDGNDLVLEWKYSRLLSWGTNTSGALGVAGAPAYADTATQVVATAAVDGKTILSTASGRDFSLAVCADGTVAAWGENGEGQLGNNSFADASTPVSVSMGGVLAGKKVVAVSAGSNHGLALCSDGTVAAWGDNTYGQLGDNTTIDKNVPVLVESTGALGGKRVTAIAAGSNHSVALCSDGSVVCWGDNDLRQLGNGGTSRSSVPVAVVTSGVLSGRTVTAVAAGSSHTLALLADGTVAAWGANALGQLGNASTSDSNVPVAVDTSVVLDGKTVTAIAAGGMTSHALCDDGTLASWGNNDHGQIGDSTTGGSYDVPRAVDTSGTLNGKTVSHLEAGYRHAAAVCIDGTVATWGWNQFGQLGNDSTTDSSIPVAVTDSMLGAEEQFSEVSGGADTDHAVAIVATGPPAPLIQVEDSLGDPLSDNGAENFGATLVDTTKIRTYTIRNIGTAPMTGIAASLFGTWQADYAILDVPATTLAPGEATTLTLAFVPSSAVPKGATLRINSNVTTDDLNPFDIVLSGSGTNSISLSYATGTEVPATTSVAPFSATGKTVNLNPATALDFVPPSGSTLVVLDNRTTEFVSGSFTGLAHGQTVSLEYEGATYPFVVSYYGGDGNDVVLLWAGTRLLAWGPNGSGTIGDGSTDPSLSPTPSTTGGVLAGRTLVSVVAGERHALALCADGTLAAWGANNIGQLGTGNATPSLEPVLVSTGAGSALNGKTVIAIAAGLDFSVALCADGTVATWGSNSAGQLGQGGGPGGFDDLPVAVTGGAITGKDPAGIAAGIDFVVVRCTDGSAVSWGANGAGQLGDGTLLDRSSPVDVDASGVLSGRSVRSLAAGHFHTLALCDDGTLAAWGDNTFGELGDGTTNGSSLPVAVAAGGVLSGRTPVGIAAGQFHCLALCSDGTLSSWGVNTEGQLGATGLAQSSLPLEITSSGALAGRTVTSVACGQGNGMAVLADGSIASWGTNMLGQVGDGTNLQRSIPVAIGQGTLVAGERVHRVGSGPTTSNGYAIVATAVVPPSGTPVLSTDDATSITKTGAMLNGVINPNGSNSSVYFEIGTDPGYGLPPTTAQPFSGTEDAPVAQAITGLEPNTTYFVRLAASYNGGLNFAYGDGKAFTTSPDPPSASAGPASNIGTNGATLNGTVDPNGRDTTAKFQLSTDPDLHSILAEYDVDDIAAGASLVARARTIGGLDHATTYYYRLIAQNPAGSQSPEESNVVSFTTSNLPPVATTGGTQPVAGNPTRITVTGSVRASNASTSVTFLYGPLGGGFPFSLTATPGTVTGDVDTPVSAELSNLQQGRTYQYKVRAENSGGAVEGSVREFDIEAISGLERVSPAPRPESDGFLTVNLSPPGLAHGWRFFGEQEWRLSGFPAIGFPTGDREIEFRPVPGWITPPSEIVSIISGVATPALERSYFEAGSIGTGSLMVTLVPASITTGPDRAQWRLLGEDGSAWRDSGAMISGLSPGNYLVECRPVAGRATPPNTSVPVLEGQTSAPTIVYRLPDAATGETPVAIGIETVTGGGDLPYSYVGQIRSRSGSGSGFVVKDRVVATAAHVVWDDITQAAVEGLQWIHQRHRGTFEPEPIEPRGFYVFDGYAAQRIADNSPGDSSPQSQHLDVAAIYFNENAARGGSGGFLASDLDDNEFLLSDADKLLVGYPVDGIDPGVRGRMHSTTPSDVDFVRGFGRTFTTSDIGSFGGNSGGPLCVQHEDGPFYPAAVYLGGNAQTVVRAIDSEVVDLFDRAETSGNGGSNNTGGGITHTGVTNIGGVDTPGTLQINLEPAGAVDAGAGWRLRPETTYRSSGFTVGNLKAARYRIELATVAGYQPPPVLKIRVKQGQAKSLTFTYALPVVQEAGISVRGNGHAIDPGDTTPSLLDHTDFGTVEVGSGSRARTFTVQNSGSAPLSLGSVLVDGTDPDDFSVSIPPATSIPPGSSTTFTILFEPSAPGIRSASVSFATNVTDANPFAFEIRGNDTTDTDSNGFTDTEEEALAELLAQFTVGQSVDLDLSFLQLASGQILELLNLPPGLGFDPGTNRISGTITGKAASSQVEIRKRDGATVASTITVDFPVFVPAEIEATGLRSFPTTLVRKRSRPQTLVLTNAGELPLDGLSVRTIGKAAKDYLVTQPLENALDPGASTTCTVRFKPRKKGTRRASIIILSSTEPKTVPVSGRGKVKKKKKKK